MELRFLRGEDREFAYEEVDHNNAFDDMTMLEREKQEEWFDDEEPSLVEEGECKPIAGETGIQDF